MMKTRRRMPVLTEFAAFAVVVAASAPRRPAADSLGEVETRNLVLMVVYPSVALVFSFMCSVAVAVVPGVSPSFIAHLRQLGEPPAARCYAGGRWRQGEFRPGDTSRSRSRTVRFEVSAR